jgi:ferredoxin
MTSISRSEKRKIPTYDNPDEIQVGEVEINYEKCSCCMICIKICPADALVMNNKKPVMVSSGAHECMACGDCAAICTEQAITVKKPFCCITGFYKTIEHGDLLPPRL